MKPETPVQCPQPEGVDAVCLKAACNPESGDCSLVPDHEGWPCEDSDLCTVADSCFEGQCIAGKTVNCNDGNPCTNDDCQPDAGCLYEYNAAQCNDSDVCTKADFCQDGQCQPGLVTVPCDDGNVCTDDACDPDAGCVHLPNQGACDDGNKCTQGEKCGDGKCGFTALVDCADDNPCTDDACSPDIGCAYALNNASCDDGDPCTKGDTCSLGACLPGNKVLCDDGNDCTDDSCQQGGGCVYTPNQKPCDDGNPCTEAGVCGDAKCLPGKAVACDDDNVCTTDWCDPQQGGCAVKFNNAPCDDGDLCTLQDHCELGECVSGLEFVCNDGSDCTTDSCVSGVGCVFTQTVFPCCSGGTWPCGDSCVDYKTDPANCGDCGKACNPGEACSGGECKPTCGPGQKICDGVCTNTTFDPANCGECDKTCPTAANASGICVASQCSLVCTGTWDDCNLDMDDGCEVNLYTDKKHCSLCGKLCPPIPNGTGACAQGECIIADCTGTYDNCDDNIATGCETDLWTNPNHCGQCAHACGQGFVCKDGDCVEQVTSFIVHETKDITFKGINYLLLKVSFGSTTAQSDNWCYEYRNLCQSYGYAPTGCGDSWPGSWYKECKTIYGSITYDTSLSCNPSGPIAQAAKDNGYSDAVWQNSFGFHYCEPTACVKVFCNSNTCNNALTYIDPTKPHGYTLCIK